MNFKISHILLVIVYLLVSLNSKAQEGTRPMTANLNYIYPELNNYAEKPKSQIAAKTTSGSIELPFFDDFYYASYSNYPNQQLWSDSTLYINTGMAKAPMSIGVATFDGLNKKGFPYNPDLTFTATQANSADSLTSKAINLLTVGSLTLQPSDSVALIFYYQLTGNGDSPEVQDSLMVDFYKPAQGVWDNRSWSLRGNTNPNNNDTVFKRAFVWITDTAYFHDGFKFRFRNKAATNGNFDNWNIDYVFLDRNRSIVNDTAWNDLTIGYVPSAFLKRYSAMPWHQFNGDEMALKYSNYIRYNGTSTVNTTYQYQIFDNANVMVNSANYGASNLPPFKFGGWQHYPAHSNPNLSYTFAPMSDSIDYTIKHFMLNLGADISINNDTVYQKQRFRNYFAYDDGSCETGYYVLGTGGRMAQKYTLNVTDTLRAIRIYFDPVGSINLTQTSYKLKVNVFNDGGFGPGPIKIFTSDSIYPKYSTTGHDKFTEYKFTNPLILGAGSYYIGLQQFVAAGVTIGFDRNTDFSSNLYFDSGNGWTQSSVRGSLMMRPVFGRKIVPPVGVQENVIAMNNFMVYPNPASNSFFIQAGLEGQEASYSIYALDGSIVAKGFVKGSESTVSTENICNGIYVLVLSSQNKNSFRQKLIIQH